MVRVSFEEGRAWLGFGLRLGLGLGARVRVRVEEGRASQCEGDVAEEVGDR